MTKEERQNLRDLIQDELLEGLLKLMKDETADPKEVKVRYDLKLAEQDFENAAKRNEIAERKLADGCDERDFSVDETVEGIQAMLGKGEAQ